MEIKRIIVDELPESCYNCRFPEAFHYATEWKCTITGKYMGDCDKRRHKDCPLDVEKECVWVLNVDYTTSCGEWIDSDIQNMHDCTFGFCPNCGKRIRYKEVK